MVSGDKSKFFISALLGFFSTGSHGPRGWAASYPECAAKNQSPVDITDEQAVVSEEYQELMLEKFNAESSNQTTMKNTGKTGVCITYFLSTIVGKTKISECDNTRSMAIFNANRVIQNVFVIFVQDTYIFWF